MRSFLINSITKLDFAVWGLVLLFFSGSSLIFSGNLSYSLAGALGIIIEMLLIGLAVEVIIECLKNTKGIGTITGFITNGPEAICLIVGLVVGDIIFAASTPLGSNFMNPILLGVAAILLSAVIQTLKVKPFYTVMAISLTATLAGSFFLLDEKYYGIWLILVLVITIPLFWKRPEEDENDEDIEYSFNPTIWLLPAIIILTGAGYYLDQVVSFTAEHSMAPKGVIGFIVLSTLTSWPEFKSCLALLSRKQHLAAVLNIVVSNITNIWLAALGIFVYWLQ